MLSLFSTPKPFHGHIGVIQINAIRSWLLLRPSCEITLCGDEDGVAEVATKFGLRHVPDIPRNEYGTPLVNSLFESAQALSTQPLICYVNADIILLSDFLSTIRMVQMPSFLIIGRRWDIDFNETIDFTNPNWETQLRRDLLVKGTLHGHFGIDYFIFPCGLYTDVPPFALGRTAWDNWLVYRARVAKVPVIDATRMITVVHQNHKYPHPLGQAGIWKGPEAERNRQLLGGNERIFGINHATHILTLQGVKPALSLERLFCRLGAIPALVPGLRFLNLPFSLLAKGLTVSRKLMNYGLGK